MEVLLCFLVPIAQVRTRVGKGTGEGDRSSLGSVNRHCTLHQGIHCPDVAILMLQQSQ